MSTGNELLPPYLEVRWIALACGKSTSAMRRLLDGAGLLEKPAGRHVVKEWRLRESSLEELHTRVVLWFGNGGYGAEVERVRQLAARNGRKRAETIGDDRERSEKNENAA